MTSPTPYTFLMAVIWCNVFIAAVAFLRKRNGFIARFSILPLLFLAFVCICRQLFFWELPHAIIIPSTRILPSILRFFTAPVFTIAGKYELSIAVIALSIWFVGSAYFLLKQLKLLTDLNGIFKCIPHTVDLRATHIMNEILAQSSRKTVVTVLRSEEIAIPVIIGYFRPRIFLPEIPLSDSDLNHILSHEWTHYLHRDAWTKLFMCLVQSLFWWNPCIHILHRDLNHILEIYCDTKVTGAMSQEEKNGYLSSILKILELHHGRKDSIPYEKSCCIASFVSTQCKTKIEQRFHLVYENNIKNKYKPHTLALYFLIAAIAIASNMVVIQPEFLSTADWGFEETYAITPENAYIKEMEDDTYALFVDAQCKGFLNSQELNVEPFSSLPIKYQN